MKKRNLTFVFAGATIISFFVTTGFRIGEKTNAHGSCSVSGQKHANGSIVGYTNSIPDGPGDCSDCHFGGATTPVFNFSATPAFGTGNKYVPGTQYTIAIIVTGYTKFGFDLEMLNGTLSSSTAAGTFTALTNSIVHPAGTYPINITHNAPINSTSSATFKWTAPSGGNVYVYASGLGANGTGDNSGDHVIPYTLVLTPSSSTGITENNSSNIELSVFPNPVTETANITYELNENAMVSANLININGQVVSSFFNKEEQSKGKQVRNIVFDHSIAKGTYFVIVNINGKNNYKKINKE